MAKPEFAHNNNRLIGDNDKEFTAKTANKIRALRGERSSSARL
jgi:hypothetical protein